MADSLGVETVEKLADRLFDEFRVLHERIANRRRHFYASEDVDPKLGEWQGGQPAPDNPYRDVPSYQSDAPRRLAQRLVARLAENPIIIDVEPASASLQPDADRLAIILNSWMRDIATRTDVNLQQAAGYYQARDCYAVLHSRLAADVWKPDTPKERDSPADGYEPYDDEETGQRRYRESAASFRARQEYQRAREGSPWHWELIDPTAFVFERDRTGKGGLARAIVRYEVSLSTYNLLHETTLSSGDSTPTDIAALGPAPGYRRPLSGQQSLTPSSSRYRDRAELLQYWDREYWCEIIRHNGAATVVKSGPNPYSTVPFWIVWANRTYSADPAWEAEPYLEGVFRQKPYWDRMVTLAAAIVELNAEPLVTRKRRDITASPLYPSGAAEDAAGPSADDLSLGPGEELQQLSIAIDPAISSLIQFVRNEMRESEPHVGSIEIGASTAPWTARIMQTEANVGPKVLMANLVQAVKGMVRMWIDWHIRNPAEALVTHVRKDERRTSKNRVVRVDPDEVDLSLFDIEVSISPVSSMEQVTMTQLYRELVTPIPGLGPLITRSEFYEKGLNKQNPEDYATQVMLEATARPYIEQYIRSKLSSIMGSRFITGVDGEIINRGNGMPVNPADVLTANGWQPVEDAAAATPQPQQPGSEGPPSPPGSRAVPPAIMAMPAMRPMGVFEGDRYNPPIEAV